MDLMRWARLALLTAVLAAPAAATGGVSCALAAERGRVSPPEVRIAPGVGTSNAPGADVAESSLPQTPDRGSCRHRRSYLRPASE